MKRTIFLRVFTFFLIVSYLVFTTISIFVNFLPIYKYWFSSFILILGLSLFVRYLCYRIDSNLFSGILLFLCGAWGILCFYFDFNIVLVIAGYFASLSLAFVSVFIKFRHFFYLKAFVFTLLYVILLTIYSNDLMPFEVFITLISVVSVMLFVLVFSSFKSKMGKV
jgi:hypothetical protein